MDENIKRYKIDKITIIIFVLLFFTSQNTVLFGTNANVMFVRLGQSILLVFSMYLLYNHNKNVFYKDLLFLVLMLGSILLSVLINEDFQMTHLFVGVAIVTGYLWTDSISFEITTEAFNKCLYLLSIYSVITMVFVLSIPSIINLFPHVENIAHSNFAYLGLSVYYNEDYFYRNYSLFREPGVFQYYLNLGVLFELMKKQINYSRMCVFIVALITTFSTTGFICAGILAVFFVFNRYKNSSIKLLVSMFFCGFILMFFVNSINVAIADYGTGYNVWNKLDGIEDIYSNANDLNSSLVTRAGSVIIDLNLMTISPWLGLAQQKIYDLYPIVSLQNFGVFLKYPTDSLFLQFAKYGLIFGLVMSFGYYGLCRKITKNTLGLVLLCSFFFIELITENYSIDVMLYIFMWYGLRGTLPLNNIIRL